MAMFQSGRCLDEVLGRSVRPADLDRHALFRRNASPPRTCGRTPVAKAVPSGSTGRSPPRPSGEIADDLPRRPGAIRFWSLRIGSTAPSSATIMSLLAVLHDPGRGLDPRGAASSRLPGRSAMVADDLAVDDDLVHAVQPRDLVHQVHLTVREAAPTPEPGPNCWSTRRPHEVHIVGRPAWRPRAGSCSTGFGPLSTACRICRPPGPGRCTDRTSAGAIFPSRTMAMSAPSAGYPYKIYGPPFEA